MKESATKTLGRFRGLNNVADQMRGTDSGTEAHESWGWQSVADNVDGTDSGGIERREGYTSFLAGTITGSYSTDDHSRAYVIDSGNLKRFYPDASTVTLAGSLSGDVDWAETNDTVYLSCGTSKIQIAEDNSVKAWGVPTPAQFNAIAASGSLQAGVYQVALTYTDSDGREGGVGPAVTVAVTDGGIALSNIPLVSGYTANLYSTEADGTVFYLVDQVEQTGYVIASNPVGPELTTQYLDPPPADGSKIGFFGGRAYVAEHIPEIKQTVVWFSQPLGFHLFNLNTDYFIVPGELAQLHGFDGGLIVGTESEIYMYDGERLTKVADYGAVPGRNPDTIDGKAYFWTKRGLCRAAPFENLTESVVSVEPGLHAGGCVMERNGYRKFVAVIQSGGDAYNQRQ